MDCCSAPAVMSINGREIPIDQCIASEIAALVAAGVQTAGCCCGHGRETPHCLIRVESAGAARALGYESAEFTVAHSAAGLVGIWLRRQGGG